MRKSLRTSLVLDSLAAASSSGDEGSIRDALSDLYQLTQTSFSRSDALGLLKSVALLVRAHPIASELLISCFSQRNRSLDSPAAKRGVSNTSVRQLQILVVALEQCSSIAVSPALVRLLVGLFNAVSALENRSKLTHLTQPLKQLFLAMEKRGELAPLVQNLLENLEDDPQAARVPLLAFVRALDLPSTPGDKLLEYYIKAVLFSRTPLPAHILSSAQPIVERVQHEAFRESLLPALTKIMLRSPEISCYAFVTALSQVRIDLSAYASDIIKSILPNLYVESLEQRECALSAVRTLVAECSNVDALQTTQTALMSLFASRESRMNLPESRWNVLRALATLTESPACRPLGASSKEALEAFALAAIEHALRLLRAEANELTLALLLHFLHCLARKLASHLPARIVDVFKLTLREKTFPHAVRVAALRVVLAAAQSPTDLLAQQHADLLALALPDALLGRSEKPAEKPSKAGAGGASTAASGGVPPALLQPLALIEALIGSSVLLECVTREMLPETKLTPLWNYLNKASEVLCSDKFLNAASEADLEALLEFAGKLFQVVQSWRASAAEQREAARSGRLLGIVARLVMCALFCPSSSSSSSSSTSAWRVRREAKTLLVRRLYLSDGELVADLLPALLEQWRVSVADGLKSEAAGSLSAGSTSKRALESMRAILLWKPTTQLLSLKFATETLFPAHSQIIAQQSPNLWRSVIMKQLSSLDVPVSQFVSQLEIFDKILKVPSPSETETNVIHVLVRLDSRIITNFVDAITSRLYKEDFLNVSRNDLEIMRFPSGKLWDKPLLESFAKSQNRPMNIKRESKLYSYKEQMAEKELREELERKKRKRERHASASEAITEDEDLVELLEKLTPKQKEQLDAQLRQEQEIRTRMLLLEKELVQCSHLLSSCMSSASATLISENAVSYRLVSRLIVLLHSPLAAEHAKKMLLAVAAGCFGHMGIKQGRLRHSSRSARGLLMSVNAGSTNESRAVAPFFHYFGQSLVFCLLRTSGPLCELPTDWIREPLYALVQRLVCTAFGALGLQETSAGTGVDESQTPDATASGNSSNAEPPILHPELTRLLMLQAGKLVLSYPVLVYTLLTHTPPEPSEVAPPASSPKKAAAEKTSTGVVTKKKAVKLKAPTDETEGRLVAAKPAAPKPPRVLSREELQFRVIRIFYEYAHELATTGAGNQLLPVTALLELALRFVRQLEASSTGSKAATGSLLSPLFFVADEQPLHSISPTDFPRLIHALIRKLADYLSCVAARPDPSDQSKELVLGFLRTCLETLTDQNLVLRYFAIECLSRLSAVLDLSLIASAEADEWRALVIERVWLTRFDANELVKSTAQKLWSELSLHADQLNQQPAFASGVFALLLKDLSSSGSANEPEGSSLQQATAQATAAFIEAFNMCANERASSEEQLMLGLKKLSDDYEKQAYLPPSEYDQFGRLVHAAPPDQWQGRLGVALALTSLAPQLGTDRSISAFMQLMIPNALNDRNQNVCLQLISACMALVDAQGREHIGVILPVAENFLKEAPMTAAFDRLRQNVVLVLGYCARHLPPSDARIAPIVQQLLRALSTPSEQVQATVANCLHPLVSAIKEELPTHIDELLERLFVGELSYAERRGAAFGLAGLVKGLPIALNTYGVINRIVDCIQDKKVARKRESALFAIECLSTVLGRMFEPYLVKLLDHMMLCVGDSVGSVREAAEHTTRVVMAGMSATGVRLVLPALLKSIDEDNWRTKASAVELLGSMAHCAPKQLSECLPQIVPRLIDVLHDSHLRVEEAGTDALQKIASVIRNPEIQALVPSLLGALQDPAANTAQCLRALNATRLLHQIDTASLALLMPVIERSLNDRTSDSRRGASLVFGSLCAQTEARDLEPYVEKVLPGLRLALLDPTPDVRASASKALGLLVRSLALGKGGSAEALVDELSRWLMEKLVSESNSADRSGAAQGLSEVIGALGTEKLARVMPDLIRSASERRDAAPLPPHVRDGHLQMFLHLPTAFGDEFIVWLAPIIPCLLQGLADEVEFVRETAIRVGQRIINMYSKSAIDLLLPQLELGIQDAHWRIRSSSVSLLGDLLFRITGVSGRGTSESLSEDDTFASESQHVALLKVLGPERSNRVLAGLYMLRLDLALQVRQNALHIWKLVVSNTPRTLREILPALFALLLGNLSSSSIDKREVAARTLGDCVRKLGERLLPEIIPVLERGLQSTSSAERQGVCIGLREIMVNATSKEHVAAFADVLLPAVRHALLDPDEGVRAAASNTWDMLHSCVGPRALDDVIGYLLARLADSDEASSDAAYALDALRQLVAVKSKVVMPYLIPKLTISETPNIRVLALLSSVSGETIGKGLSKILPSLLLFFYNHINLENPAKNEEHQKNCQQVLLAVTDEAGVRFMLEELLGTATKQTSLAVASHVYSSIGVHPPPSSGSSAAVRERELRMRCTALMLLSAVLTSHASLSVAPSTAQLLRGLVGLLAQRDTRLLELTWDAIGALVKRMDTTLMQEHISSLRQALRFALLEHKSLEPLPGFTLPNKGIGPIVNILKEGGLVAGHTDLKEQAAFELAVLISWSTADALKSSYVSITGAIIRVLGERYPASIKLASLDVLSALVIKGSMHLKQYLPPLHMTLMKLLVDGTSRALRVRTGQVFARIAPIHHRLEQLQSDLVATLKPGAPSHEDAGVRETSAGALRMVLAAAGTLLSPAARKSLLVLLLASLSAPTSGLGSPPFTVTADDATRVQLAAAIGALAAAFPRDTPADNPELSALLSFILADAGGNKAATEWQSLHTRLLAFQVALKSNAALILREPAVSQRVLDALSTSLASDRIPLVVSALRSTGYGMLHWLQFEEASATCSSQITLTISKMMMRHESVDVKQLIVQILAFVYSQVIEKALAAANAASGGDSSVATPSLDALTRLPAFSPPVMRSVLVALVNGAKERSLQLRANSENALVDFLFIRWPALHKQHLAQIIGQLESESGGLADSVRELSERLLAQGLTPVKPVHANVSATAALDALLAPSAAESLDETVLSK